jgi:dienelactone hydrolase
MSDTSATTTESTTTTGRTKAPTGDLATYTRETFEHGGESRVIYRKGTGPAVIVITEMPGMSPMVIGFADRVVALGCTAIMPHLFGDDGRDPFGNGKLSAGLYGLRSLTSVCISREFTTFAIGKSSPVVNWLRGLSAAEHARCGGPGVGVVGMCFTGGFALAMAVDDHVLAPVMSQPSVPFPITARHKASIDTSPVDLATVAGRCSAEGLRVLGLRFDGDPYVPRERFAYLREQLGDGFVAIELQQSDGNPDGPLPKKHSVLTGDLIDEPGQPTRAALDQVLDLFRTKLLTT